MEIYILKKISKLCFEIAFLGVRFNNSAWQVRWHTRAYYIDEYIKNLKAKRCEDE